MPDSPGDPTPEFDGDIARLAAEVRRSPERALAIRAAQVVRFMIGQWREADDLYALTDEMPLTAWVVRKKAAVIVPPPASEAEEDDAAPRDTGDWAEWREFGVRTLKTVYQRGQASWGRDPTIPPRPPAPVKQATVWRLAWSWPRVRPPRVVPPVMVAAEDDPLSRRIERLRAALAESEGPIAFGGLGLSSAVDQVPAFLALLHLWQRDEVAVTQTDSYQEIWMTRGGRPGGNLGHE